MVKDPQTLESLPNIGKIIAGHLRQIGIGTRDEFFDRDPYEVFAELKEKIDSGFCRCMLASIVGAHHGVKWNLIHKPAAREFEARYPGHAWGSNC